MIVWRGLGWVTLFILVGCMTGIPGAWRLAHGVTDLRTLQAIRYDIPFAASLIICGLILAALGLYLNRNPNRPVVEWTTGRNVRAGGQHSLYHLRMEYRGYAALTGGLIMLVLLLQSPDRWAGLAH